MTFNKRPGLVSFSSQLTIVFLITQSPASGLLTSEFKFDVYSKKEKCQLDATLIEKYVYCVYRCRM